MKKRKPRQKQTWRGDYRLYGIFGYPLAHTFSPDMHNAAFRALGLKSFYISLPVSPAHFQRLRKHLQHAPLDGFNLTVPHKERILGALSALDKDAKAIGAVNTVVSRGRKLIGYNTDAYGFAASIKKDASFKLKGTSAVVLGAGGAARACVYALLQAGAREVLVANRTPGKAEKLVRHFSRLARAKKARMAACALRGLDKKLRSEWPNITLVVNATRLGLKPRDPLPMNPDILPHKKTLIVDLIYNPPETKLLSEARRRGHTGLNGRGMLLYQGAKSFELWTGKRAPLEVMDRALRAQETETHEC